MGHRYVASCTSLWRFPAKPNRENGKAKISNIDGRMQIGLASGVNQTSSGVCQPTYWLGTDDQAYVPSPVPSIIWDWLGKDEGGYWNAGFFFYSNTELPAWVDYLGMPTTWYVAVSLRCSSGDRYKMADEGVSFKFDVSDTLANAVITVKNLLFTADNDIANYMFEIFGYLVSLKPLKWDCHTNVTFGTDRTLNYELKVDEGLSTTRLEVLEPVGEPDVNLIPDWLFALAEEPDFAPRARSGARDTWTLL